MKKAIDILYLIVHILNDPRVKEALEQLVKLFKPKKKLMEYRISSTKLYEILRKAYPDGAFHLWDYDYWYVSHEDWGRIFEDVLLKQPKYTKDKWDCEQFALLTTARVGEKYQLNSCGIAIGESPFGEHGYNLFLSDVEGKLELFLLEPQNGDVYNVGEESGYKPRLVILG